MKYILKGKEVIPVDLLEWAHWFETAERHVGNDTIGKVHVSTVFLGIDHQFGEGKPLLFETMIFGGEHDGFQERYSTWEEAEKGHKRTLELVREVNMPKGDKDPKPATRRSLRRCRRRNTKYMRSAMKFKVLGEEEIRRKLGEIQPEGFDWTLITGKAIAQAQLDDTYNKMNTACEIKIAEAKREERKRIQKFLAYRAYPEDDGMEFYLTNEEWQTLQLETKEEEK